MGKIMDIMDAELVAITKSTKIANQNIRMETTKIWIFTDSKKQYGRSKPRTTKQASNGVSKSETTSSGKGKRESKWQSTGFWDTRKSLETRKQTN